MDSSPAGMGSPAQYLSRLKHIASVINAEYDVAGLCDALPGRVEELRAWKDDGSSSQKLGISARMHLLLYRQLHEQRDHDRTWKLAPKHHMFLHCAEQQATSPMLQWTYRDEDEIGRAVEIGSGVNPAQVRVKLLERYCWSFSFL